MLAAGAFLPDRPLLPASASQGPVPRAPGPLRQRHGLQHTVYQLRHSAADQQRRAAAATSGAPGGDGDGDIDGRQPDPPPAARKVRRRRAVVPDASPLQSVDEAPVNASTSSAAADGGAAVAKPRRTRTRKVAPPDEDAPTDPAISADAPATPRSSTRRTAVSRRAPAAAAALAGPAAASLASAGSGTDSDTDATRPRATSSRSPRSSRTRPASTSAPVSSGSSGSSSGSGNSGSAGAGSSRSAPARVEFSSRLPGPAFDAPRRWVVFSDLHVREASLDTCIQVLQAVEAHARERDAGILFLGDFWDKRGVLPVEPLNRVLGVLSGWRTPTLMLVGNHDQVDLGGLQHALTPLEHACPDWVHVVERPLLWGGALWLPYRREAWELTQAMAQAFEATAPTAAAAPAEAAAAQGAEETAAAAKAAAANEGGPAATLAAGSEVQQQQQPLRAVFVHADVRTARMNQWRQAEGGLEPSAFPPHLPVYSGHYHLPHTVRGTSITYVGSPYQVSMSEASESKRLLVLAAGSWEVLEEIPLSLGPRHVRSNGAAAAEQLIQLAAATAAGAAGAAAEGDGAAAAVGGDASGSGSDAEGGGAGGGAGVAGLRAGDRVKWRLSAAEAADEAVVRAVEQLERAGVAVEQVLQPESRAPRISAAEDVSPERLLQLYADAVGLSAEGRGAAQAALAEARDATAGGWGGGPAGRCVELQLESVSLEGFGPFKEQQTYPLAQRGVRVISGENLDEVGADSNGAGKTSLVTAPLWALTGDVLARTESGGGRTAVDAMRNDESGACRVELRGQLNGQAFVVEREVKKGKTSKLRYELDGRDLTLQDVRSTEDLIARSFSTDLLRVAAFFGQNDITALLEANDAALKQKLGLVVEMELWEAARKLLVKPKQAAGQEADAQRARADLLAGQREGWADEAAALLVQEAAWGAELERRVAAAQQQVGVRAAEAQAAAAALAPLELRCAERLDALRGAASGLEAAQRLWGQQLAAQQEQAAREAAELSAAQQQASAQQAALGAASQASASASADEAAAGPNDKEREAAEELRRRQEAAAALQRTLGEHQRAASLALGRLRQLEADLGEYVGAVSAAAARATHGSPTHGSGAGNGNGHVHARTPAAASLSSGDGAGGAAAPSELLARDAAGRVVLAAAGSGNGGGGGGGAESVEEAAGGAVPAVVVGVCDRCRQPIGAEQYAANLSRMEGAVGEARQAHEAASVELKATAAAHASAVQRVQEADAQCRALAQQRTEAARRAAAEALQAAEAAQREAREAAAAAVRSQQEAWQRAQRALGGVQERLALTERLRGSLQAAASELERVLPDVRHAAALHAQHAQALARDAPGSTDAPPAPQQAPPHPEGAQQGVAQAGPPAHGSPLAQSALGRPSSHPLLGSVRTEDTRGDWEGAAGAGGVASSAGMGAGAGAEGEGVPAEHVAALVASAGGLAAEARRAAAGVGGCVGAWQAAAAAAEAAAREQNPRRELRERAEREAASLGQLAEEARAAQAAAEARAAALSEAERALSRTGVPSFVLEGVVAELQDYTTAFLNELCDGFVLQLTATRPAAGAAGAGGGGRGARGAAAAAGAEKEEITKTVLVRSKLDGALRPRDVRQLSGGERRRVALALSLGFEALVRKRRRLASNVIVLDEVLQQLDNVGCERVAGVLRDLPHDSVLLVGQTNSSVTQNFEVMDVVVKQAGSSSVRLAEQVVPR